MEAQKFCLKWDGFQGSVTSVFDHLRQDSELVDVTLCCDGQRVRAHRMMLSACSPYFRELFKELSCQQLVVFLKDTSAADLTAIVEFMYKGSVNVAQSQLASFIKTAEMLQVQGLSGGDDKEPSPAAPPEPEPVPERDWIPERQPARAAAASPAEPPHKRRRPDPGALEPTRHAPPPPPPPVEPRCSLPPEQRLQSPEPTLQQSAASQLQDAVKVEKFDVDLTLDDEAADGGGGGDLEAALGHVAQYEGFDPSSDHSLSADGQMFAAADGTLSDNAAGGYTPGPSQRGAEDGSQGDVLSCSICGARFPERRRLTQHFKKHMGNTTCLMCQREFASMYGLRRHMLFQHKLEPQKVDTLTEKKWSLKS